MLPGNVFVLSALNDYILMIYDSGLSGHQSGALNTTFLEAGPHERHVTLSLEWKQPFVITQEMQQRLGRWVSHISFILLSRI